jgi:hypothetical protein
MNAYIQYEYMKILVQILLLQMSLLVWKILHSPIPSTNDTIQQPRKFNRLVLGRIDELSVGEFGGGLERSHPQRYDVCASLVDNAWHSV